MNLETGQWRTFLGCNLIDEALATIAEEWDQHIANLHHSIVGLCNQDLRSSETSSYSATQAGRRERRFTAAQKALQALLNSANISSINSSLASTDSVKRVTRAQARKRVKENNSITGSGGNRSLESNSSVNETKSKRNLRAKVKKDDKDETFVKPPAPTIKPDTELQCIKNERDETDFKTLDCDEFMSFKVSPIPKLCEPTEEGEDPSMWNVKRTEIISQPKKEEPNLEPIPTNEVEFEVVTPTNAKKVSPESAPQDSEWTTDDESFESVRSIGDETYQRMTRKKSPGSSHKLSTVKKKRKQTEYFTPSIPRKSSRLTRQTAKLEITPKVECLVPNNFLTRTASAVKCSRKVLSEKSSGTTTSGSSIASSAATITSSLGRSESVKGKTAVSRTCTTPDTKSLTASALKRRLDEDEKRRAQLAQLEEKEKKANQQRQENLKQKALSTKMKNEERMKKIELKKKKEEEEMKEKRKKELSKQREMDERRREKEEARRREALRMQEALKRKKEEFELRKQQEEEDRRARLLKQEEQNRKKAEENIRIKKEQDRILEMIVAHNKNIQQKAPVPQKSEHLAPTFKHPLPLDVGTPPVLPLNSTFNVDKEPEPEPESKSTSAKKEDPVPNENYPLTPPPKPKPSPVNYDISDIKSDDDTDDEDRPRKQIPPWAKGDALLDALDKQFAKSRRAREKEIRHIFPNFDFSIRLSEIFKSNRVVHPKYDKRTSSAVWSSPPCNSTFNCSVLTDDS
ncbi:inner centromere protein A [Tetranychus urticae]|uniref:Inner centromere protein ARK-binding domain-containing protein n=1 Tax=Tetranychus urticae TaxID=32264 RepID=T1L241_TETUR|nr:inner centromere protein A [Tetranychus urticae]